MVLLYIMATVGCFLGCLRMIENIGRKKWLSNILLLISTSILTLCSIKITHITNMLSFNDSIKQLLYYFSYLFILILFFYFLAKYLNKSYKDKSC